MIKIGKIELGDFPLLLAPMEDVSDPPFVLSASKMVPISCIPKNS